MYLSPSSLSLLIDRELTRRKDWPYCGVARRMVQAATAKQDMSSWDGFQWRRKMEAFGNNDESIVAAGPGGEIEAVWLVTLDCSDETELRLTDLKPAW
jgi:hypothetical protein